MMIAKTHSYGDFDEVIEGILLSSDTPAGKLRRIIKLGVDEEYADELVGVYQSSQLTPLYYERLDYDDSDFKY